MKHRIAALLMLSFPAVFAGVANASELLDCYAAIEQFSKGPGTDIGRWEQWGGDARHPRHRQTIAVPGVRGRAEGIYFYTEVGAYFAPQPQDRDTKLFGFGYDLEIPDRYPFRCETSSQAETWADVSAKRYRKMTRCWLFNQNAPTNGRFRRIRPAPLVSREDPEAALRTAVSLRISSVAEEYRREVESYRDRLAEYLGSQRATGMAATFRGLAGWAPRRPLPPSPERRVRALNGCLNTENEVLRSQARTAIRLLEMTSVPTESSVLRECGN